MNTETEELVNQPHSTKLNTLIKQLNTTEEILICDNYKKCIRCTISHNIPHKRDSACKIGHCSGPGVKISVQCKRI